MISFSPFTFFKVKGSSMGSSLGTGDYVLLLKTSHVKRGDVVVARKPNSDELIIKRVLELLNDKIFVIGDNRPASTDSRSFGAIFRNQVIGRVIWTFKKPKQASS